MNCVAQALALGPVVFVRLDRAAEDDELRPRVTCVDINQ